MRSVKQSQNVPCGWVTHLHGKINLLVTVALMCHEKNTLSLTCLKNNVFIGTSLLYISQYTNHFIWCLLHDHCYIPEEWLKYELPLQLTVLITHLRGTRSGQFCLLLLSTLPLAVHRCWLLQFLHCYLHVSVSIAVSSSCLAAVAGCSPSSCLLFVE